MNIHKKSETFLEVTHKVKVVQTKKINLTKELVFGPYVHFVPCEKTKKNLGGPF